MMSLTFVLWSVTQAYMSSLAFALCFAIVRNLCGREHDDTMDDLDVNMTIWDTFLSTTLQAAVQLGQDYEAIFLELCGTVIK